MRRVLVGTNHAELRLDDIVPSDTPLAELTECALMGIVVNAGSRRGVVAHSSPRWPAWSSATWCFIEIGRRIFHRTAPTTAPQRYNPARHLRRWRASLGRVARPRRACSPSRPGRSCSAVRVHMVAARVLAGGGGLSYRAPKQQATATGSQICRDGRHDEFTLPVAGRRTPARALCLPCQGMPTSGICSV